ncbi:helix-turn-helix transcriptional regulator [Butyrivibrio hungatei]|uniref:WYL domain-containing protein n=1 Tax=Butyrivibrio hungatei TaxID=185008 RepID=A0A1D9NZZ6_9FIRM|nr:WYL domain-containing protein [Butyrivibrio hungatei]AOZ95948.1 WYL domain-containing protein [Butyrivibrio hungatei]
MYATGNKKMLNMLILEILRQYTDENHSLTQQEIIKLLKKNYDMPCDRRSVKANVLSLKELGYEIDMEDGYRLLDREFDDAELRILIDSVLFSKSISTKQAKDLIAKLQGLASNYFNAKVSHVSNLPELNRTINKQAMYGLDTLNDAIAAKHQVSFMYNDVGTDFKLHPRWNMHYIVNPYQIVACNGRFYLIGNYDRYDNVSHFRIDKMTEVKELDTKVKPMKQVEGLEHGLNLPKHMAEHVYMFSGPAVNVKMETTPEVFSDIIDWFGTDIKILEEYEDKLIIRVSCNEKAMRYWALQYGPSVEILEPESLRNQIISDMKDMMKRYSD